MLRVKSVLEAHQLIGAAVEPLFETMDLLANQVKKLEAVIEQLTAQNEAWINNPDIRRKAMEMQAAAFNTA